MKEVEIIIDDETSIKITSKRRSRRDDWYKPWSSIERNKREMQETGLSLKNWVDRHSQLNLATGHISPTATIPLATHHDLLVFGQLEPGKQVENGEDMVVRVHSSCQTNEVFHATNCECRQELQEAMRLIQQEKRGAIVYLEQEGRGTGIAGKMAQLNGMFEWKDGRVQQRIDPQTGERIDTDRAYVEAGYPSEARDFTVAGEMLKAVGIRSVRLLTNNPRKIVGIEQAGIRVTPVEIHIAPDNEIIASDLQSKARNLGHRIEPHHWTYRGGAHEG